MKTLRCEGKEPEDEQVDSDGIPLLFGPNFYYDPVKREIFCLCVYSRGIILKTHTGERKLKKK